MSNFHEVFRHQHESVPIAFATVRDLWDTTGDDAHPDALAHRDGPAQECSRYFEARDDAAINHAFPGRDHGGTMKHAMQSGSTARLVIPLLVVAAAVHVAEFAPPALDALILSRAPMSGCGCGADCTCGCRCCGETESPPSCCSAGVAGNGGGPIWTGACACGTHGDGGVALIRHFRPALPIPRSQLFAGPARAGLVLESVFQEPTRALSPDEPVPRPRS